MNILSILLVFILININLSYAECSFWICNVDEGIRWSNENKLTDSIVHIVLYILTFTAFLSVLFTIKWWFQILTAASDDEKVKNWKKTVIYSLLWLFVIMVAYTIVDAVFTAVETVSK